jgi:hypothetical protein
MAFFVSGTFLENRWSKPDKMKLRFYYLLLAASMTLFTSCEIVGDIFQAGMYWGIFLVVAVVALIMYFVFKLRR